MKMNRSAVWLVRIRGIMLSLALVGIAGIVFCFGESLAMRFGQTTTFLTGGAQVPNVNAGDLLAAAH
jgi:hypothetical protein